MDLGGITLPDNVYWDDRWAWDPVRHAESRSAAGSLVVQQSSIAGGRPITLIDIWVTRSTAEALQTLSEQLGTTHTLTLPGGDQYAVIFRRGGDDPPVAVEELFPAAPDVQRDSDYVTLTLRLTEASSAYIG